MKNKVIRCFKHNKPVLEKDGACPDFMSYFDSTNPYGFGAIKECWNCRFTKEG